MKPALQWTLKLGLPIGLGVLMYLQLRRMNGHTCEVCVDFAGHSNCAKAAAPDEGEAIRTAQSTACATLASGRVESMSCEAMPASKTVCSGGPE